MQHIFKFQIKHKEEEHPIESFYNTQSSRMGKVADRILADVNDLRLKAELPSWQKEDLEYFRVAKFR